MYLTVLQRFIHKGADVEGNEEPVEEVVGEDVVETLDVQAEDVRDVVKMVQVFSH